MDKGIEGFWLYCDSVECLNLEKEGPVAGLIFEDSICHVFIAPQFGLDPEIIASNTYYVKNDSLYSQEKSKLFIYGLKFINDSTLQLSNDSMESVIYRGMK